MRIKFILSFLITLVSMDSFSQSIYAKLVKYNTVNLIERPKEMEQVSY